MNLKCLSKRNNPAEVKKRKKFIENMKKVFWIGENPLNMIEKIRKDMLRNQNDKEEDITFLRDQLEERKGKVVWIKYFSAHQKESINLNVIIIN